MQLAYLNRFTSPQENKSSQEIILRSQQWRPMATIQEWRGKTSSSFSKLFNDQFLAKSSFHWLMTGVFFAFCLRYAVVTGANKGIGLETVRQIASKGVTVVLTARDEKRGTDATCMLHNMGLTNVVFHQLDVLDPVSIESLAKFIKDRFGRLDILVRVHFQERLY